jgi:hypothetical protein
MVSGGEDCFAIATAILPPGKPRNDDLQSGLDDPHTITISLAEVHAFYEEQRRMLFGSL